MRETLNRIARHADNQGENVLVMIDQVNEKTRAQRLPVMYSHILGRTAGFPEMARIAEPPMHIDSVLSSNIQFADWIAAAVTRAIEYQLIKDSPFKWVTNPKILPNFRGAFSYESKLHLHQRSVSDLNRGAIYNGTRPLYPIAQGHLLGDRRDLSYFTKIKAAADRRAKQRTTSAAIGDSPTPGAGPDPVA